MLRIDFYVQQLMKHQANGVRLVSEMPVTFHFDAGDRQSNKPIEHDLLVAMVQESAPQDLDPVDLDPQAVAAKIRQYRGALVACYEAALKRNASLSGKITLRFSVNTLGKVSHVEIEVDTMHDEDFAKCIVDRASTWRFPPPKSGSGDVQFAYPFIFQSSK